MTTRQDCATITKTPPVSKQLFPLRLLSTANQETEFYVPGTSIPDVDFDVGESYAGLLPISSSAEETRELFFWFFPSNITNFDDLTTTNINTTHQEDGDLVIWLNGGPGCSSLEGLLQENGPFSWKKGTWRPVPNPYSWNRLANMLWVEQPVGTGYTRGVPNITNEADLARQFLGFLELWLSRFNLRGRRIFVTGESYAGVYVPYIVPTTTHPQNRRRGGGLTQSKGGRYVRPQRHGPVQPARADDLRSPDQRIPCAGGSAGRAARRVAGAGVWAQRLVHGLPAQSAPALRLRGLPRPEPPLSSPVVPAAQPAAHHGRLRSLEPGL